jgi:RNA-binding protein
MNELTPSERRALKARAHPLVPVVLVGDKGLTGAVLAEIERAVAVHELIKIRVQAEKAARAAMLGEICAKTNASAVQHIGKILVVYRKKPPEAPQPKERRVPVRKAADRKSIERPARPAQRDRDPFTRPRRPTTAARRMAKAAAREAVKGTGRPGSRTASPRRAPARPPGRRRTSR